MSYLILKYKTQDEVIAGVNRLSGQVMREGSHGYEIFGEVPIMTAALAQVEVNLANNPASCPAIKLMAVILAANRNFNRQVAPHVKKMSKKYSNLTLIQLKKMIESMSHIDFKSVWGHSDLKKFNLLRDVVDSFLDMAKPGQSDHDVISEWAKKTNLATRHHDRLGSIQNLGIATFQHLRIVFGIDTVKPDQRVKEVLLREFDAKLSSEKAVIAVEEIANICSYKTMLIDQIFVKYGSGYY